MHIYYYYKDGYVYVMNNNHKLYRYMVTNNIELILNTENLIVEYTKILKEEPVQYRFKVLKEFNFKEQYNLSQFLLYLGLVQHQYFPNNGTLFYFIKLLGMLNINHYYSLYKEKNDSELFIYERLLEELLQDLEEQLEFLNRISPYSKEEVSYKFIDSTCEKHYIQSIESLTEIYDDEIDFLLEANISPTKFFNDSLLKNSEITLDKDCQQYIHKKRMK